MGKLQLFQIKYDSAKGVYFGGQHVTGHVIISLSDAMKVGKLRLELRGRASTRWTIREQQQNKGRQYAEKVIYRAEESYLNSSTTLFPMGSASKTVGDSDQLEAGIHQIKFSVQLPATCPTSFEGKCGNIRYHAKGVIERPWKFNHTTKAPFTIINLLDLNLDPYAVTPFRTSANRNFGKACCAKGPVNCDVILDRRGYVPGEKIALKVRVNNESSRSIKKVSAELIQSTAYSGRRKVFHLVGAENQVFASTNSDSRTVATVNSKDEVKGGDILEYDFSDSFVVPPVPSCSASPGLIQIAYWLKVLLEPSDPPFIINVDVPIIIGSIPLRQMFSVIQPPPPEAQPEPLPEKGAEGPSAPPEEDGAPYHRLYPDLPLPTYESCMFGQISVKDDEDDPDQTEDEVQFAPKYPVFTFPSAPQRQ